MLLSGIAIDGVVQVIREIGIEIEERRGTGT
jgi:biotin operon repressor